MLDFSSAAATAPLLARWLGEPEPDPQWFAGDSSAEADGLYLSLYFNAIKRARTLGQPCPIFLHPKLRGVEGRQVTMKVNGQAVQCWVGHTDGWLPKHTIRQRSNGTGYVEVDPQAHIEDVQVISNFARIT